ncbi:MAG: ClpX C4-type zinc finger protein [Cyanobacteriota bacterium]
MSDNEEKKVVSLAGARESKDKDKEKEKDKPAEEKKETVEKPVICSFCERPNYQVIKMIQGPGVNICSECTMVCVQYFMLSDRIPTQEAQKVLDAFWNLSRS